MTPEPFEYEGKELNVFFHAVNWKRYWASKIDQYLGNSVLEVGAGIGGTTRHFINQKRELWLGLEPDQAMFKNLTQQKEQSNIYPSWCQFLLGTVDDLSADEMFDSIIYIDVLEHIEDDQLELESASRHLNESGYLIVLSPAYQFLFTEFDAAIGHHRRYTRNTLPRLNHVKLCQIRSFYLDSVGLLTSLANKFILHSPKPSINQIKFWDSYILPFSKIIDPLIRYSAGRSIISIWQKTNPTIN